MKISYKRLYDRVGGEILIDGVDIKNYSHQALHRLITIVQQEPVLFARSIKENILYGELNIKEEDEEHEIDVAVTKGMLHTVCSICTVCIV